MKKNKTISDFGHQWRIHGSLDNDYWTSNEMFLSHFRNSTPPFVSLQNKCVADVGSGSGRIVSMLLRFNPKSIYGIEPSQGFFKLKENLKNVDNLILLNQKAEEFCIPNGADFIFSLGVIHHIPNPGEAVKNIYENLKSDGYFVMWLYGYENNEIYVLFQKLLRPLIRLLPDYLLNALSFMLTYLVDFYLKLSEICFANKLPLSNYLKSIFYKCGRKEKKYIIFDQLNPSYAKYYKRQEVLDLLSRAGFTKIDLYHRFSYSWTAVAQK